MSEKTDPKKDDLEVSEKDAAAIKGGVHKDVNKDVHKGVHKGVNKA